MTCSRTLPGVLALALLAVYGCAVSPIEIEPYREVSCFEGAGISLKTAVEAAEKSGGKAIDADYIQDKEMGCVVGQPGYYEVTLLSQGKLNLVSVEARSGRVEPRVAAATSGDLVETLFESPTAAKARVVPKVTITLSEAIAIAEKGGGKAMEASIDMNGDRPGYAIKLVDKGKLHMAWVDGKQL